MDAALLDMRFDATIYPGTRSETNWADNLNVDRVPGSKVGEVRALLSVEDMVRLLKEGLEIRLTHAYAAEPLNPSLIMTDKSFQSWLDDRVNQLKAKP